MQWEVFPLKDLSGTSTSSVRAALIIMKAQDKHAVVAWTEGCHEPKADMKPSELTVPGTAGCELDTFEQASPWRA